LSSNIDAERVNLSRFGQVSLTLVTVGLPFAESAMTSLQAREWQDNGWWWGAGIEWSDEDYIYQSSSFTVPNFGNVAIDPRFMQLIVRFNGASTNLRIQNLTTGDDWQYTGTTLVGDQIRLEGIRSLKNGTSIVRDTNFQLIKLDPGINQFAVTGATGAYTISFEFRYHYN
jgi:hypothetical protein